MIIAVVVSNLLYLGGALAVAILGALVVVLRQRKPRSVEANVASFHKGLRALAPDDEGERPAARPSWGGAHKPVLVRPDADDETVDDAIVDDAEVAGDDADPADAEGGDGDAGPGDDVSAPVDLAAHQRTDVRHPIPSEGSGPSEEAETG